MPSWELFDRQERVYQESVLPVSYTHLQLDILHANAGIYVGGDLIDADTDAIDRMLNLNVNVVMKNVHDVLPHMIERRTGDIIVTSSLAAHYPTPWEPVYASSKWAINAFVQIVRRQVFKHGIRVGSISPGPVITSLLSDWPEEKLKEARESGSLIEASEIALSLIHISSQLFLLDVKSNILFTQNDRPCRILIGLLCHDPDEPHNERSEIRCHRDRYQP